MLKVSEIDVYHGDLQALGSVCLEVKPPEMVAVIGANGAGKSTLLRTISGIHRPARGTIEFKGQQIHHTSPSRIVQMGIGHVPEGRQLFPTMSVEENLEMGSQFKKSRERKKDTMAFVLELFPVLKHRLRQRAETLSGGEQQMLAIARGLMSLPELLMLDEPSLGLSPLLVRTIFKILQEINQKGTMVLLVEQNVFHALSLAGSAYVLENGSIVKEGRGEDLLADEHVKKAYLGL